MSSLCLRGLPLTDQKKKQLRLIGNFKCECVCEWLSVRVLISSEMKLKLYTSIPTIWFPTPPFLSSSLFYVQDIEWVDGKIIKSLFSLIWTGTMPSQPNCCLSCGCGYNCQNFKKKERWIYTEPNRSVSQSVVLWMCVSYVLKEGK